MNKKLYFLMATLFALLLAACGGGPGGPGGGPEADGGGGSDELASELSVYNWAEYIDEQVLADYEEEFGVKIIYDTYASNEDLLAKLQAGATGYDVIFPSDYMVAQMIDLGLLSEIDTSAMSNVSNLDPAFLDAPFDPGNKYCVPYQWGTTGIAYSTTDEFLAANPPDSWSFMFEPEKLEQFSAGGINLLNDPREGLAAALIYLGHDANSASEAEINEARDLIITAKEHYKTFNSEDYPTSLMIPGEVVLSHAWSGGAAQAFWETYDEEADAAEWGYVIPKEGAVKWLDNICITESTERFNTAQHFVNYLLEGEVGAAITNYTYYASPNTASNEFIVEEILNDPSIYPPADVQENLHWLDAPEDDETIFTYDAAWTAIKGQ